MIRIGAVEAPLLDMLREQTPRARHTTVAAMLRHGGLVDRAAIDRRIKQLVDAGLLTRAYAMCRPLPALDAPLYTCNPAKERFAYDRAGELAWKLERRWTRGSLERVRIYGPSRKLLGIYGGVTKPRIGNESQLSHDTTCAAVYAHYLITNPAFASAVESEFRHVIPKTGRVPTPDFIVVDSSGRAVMAIEIGGVYDARRLRRQFADLERRGLVLELW
jgi:hypothetical protein